MIIPVIQNVLKLNDEVAAMNRAMLRDAGVFAIDLIGAPGCGKTALLEETIRRLDGVKRVAVICGDLATQRDADRVARHGNGAQVVQINTGKGCHLEANHVHQALQQLSLENVDILFIENVGNLICPVGFDLGQNVKVGIFAIAGGDDKAAKHPALVNEARLLLLSQVDLAPYVPFDQEQFRRDIGLINAHVPLLPLSSVTGEGMARWIRWLRLRHACQSPLALQVR
jgi:hydrogenase nickel incorporation protein HypB